MRQGQSWLKANSLTVKGLGFFQLTQRKMRKAQLHDEMRITFIRLARELILDKCCGEVAASILDFSEPGAYRGLTRHITD